MKKYLLILIFFFVTISDAQNYNDIANFAIEGTPVNGVKIKTNLPFLPFSQLPTISIKGFNYGSSEPISLTIVYYIYHTGSDAGDSSSYYFHQPRMSSSGSYTPPVYLSNENGKVVIFINDKSYYQRFTVSAYAQGMQETSSWFQGWTIVDEAMNGTKTVEIPYQNRFKGNVYLSGGGIWNATGNVGIGTENPDAKLAVKGKIHSEEVKVDLTVPAPDYVFSNDYQLRSLKEVETYVNQNSHLPEVPSAKEFEKNGIHLAEMNMALLKKVEELTLYAIGQEKKTEQLIKIIEDQNERLKALEKSRNK
ncbi:tail fiber protein [Flavobacterium sp.]|uniref:tail fiber protein n=1 Tax=unclassified Flavobacterium TaxID=196869 RepID=UPI0025BA21B5|nr:tail fiber protein [Flavobacterium sp.]